MLVDLYSNTIPEEDFVSIPCQASLKLTLPASVAARMGLLVAGAAAGVGLLKLSFPASFREQILQETVDVIPRPQLENRLEGAHDGEVRLSLAYPARLQAQMHQLIIEVMAERIQSENGQQL